MRERTRYIGTARRIARIMLLIAEKPRSIAELADRLNTSHQTILRTVKELADEHALVVRPLRLNELTWGWRGGNPGFMVAPLLKRDTTHEEMTEATQ